MIEKRRERGFIYQRGMGLMDGAIIALLIVADVTVEVDGGLVI